MDSKVAEILNKLTSNGRTNYLIAKDVEVKLNKVTPLAIKFYQGVIKDKFVEIQNTDDAVRQLDIFLNEEFAKEWAFVVFEFSEEQKKKFDEVDFDREFYWDEFMEGFADFLSKLNPLMKRQIGL